ncbi:hypothetical protein HHK36_005540 [Tetracentron sinense]|uniref:KOW domain-containing protein n=1 Tax=Tetracentron sinense TaxID=13715 RepID=A0A834ZL73_TETSI|nr:hypothetical protein HHK36_005540 [Tetracentron sinense]
MPDAHGAPVPLHLALLSPRLKRNLVVGSYYYPLKEQSDTVKTSMAAMTALQSSMTSLSLSSSSFLGQRFSPSLCPAQIKRWERKECKPNSLPVLQKMHVKLGDTVKIISGHEKGKIGEITKIFKHNSSVIVKDMNLKTKHVKSREEGEQGQIVKVEARIHSSNVMLYSKEQNVASRVGHKILEDGSRVRYLLKTGEIIDSTENWKRVIKDREKTEQVAAS